MKINIADIKHTPSEKLDFSLCSKLDPALYGYGEYTLPEPVSCQGRIRDNHQGGFEAAGAYQATAVLSCSRCGQDYALPLSRDFSALFVPLQGEDWDGETSLFPIQGDLVDLGEVLAGEIFFALPMQPLCQEGCQGLCPVCGADLNKSSCACQRESLDPRWEKLKNLTFDD